MPAWPWSILPSSSANCVRQGAELAAPRDQAGGDLPRPDDQRAVGLEEFARQGDEVEPRAGRAGQIEGMAEFLDDPGLAQQPPGQRGETRLGLDEAVGAAEHAGPALQVDFRPRPSSARRGVEPEEAHAAAETLRLGLQVLQQFLAGRGHDVLRRRPKATSTSGADLDADGKQVGHQAEDFMERAGRGVRPGRALPSRPG